MIATKKVGAFSPAFFVFGAKWRKIADTLKV